MTSIERDQFTKLCRGILAATDHQDFSNRAEELHVFLDSVLPPEEEKEQLGRAASRSLS